MTGTHATCCECLECRSNMHPPSLTVGSIVQCCDHAKQTAKRCGYDCAVRDAYFRFLHLDSVLRAVATADDPIYKTAAALWEAIVEAQE